MRKTSFFFFLILLFLLSKGGVSANAQKPNQQKRTISEESLFGLVNELPGMSYPPAKRAAEMRLRRKYYVYVDLGLSVKWASCNVGADMPEEYGDYYAWGETSVKSYYSFVDYVWNDSSDGSMKKYNSKEAYGKVDGKTRLHYSDDVAQKKWGDRWRIPTDDEWAELRDKCTWTWTKMNGKDGYLVTSKKNGNSIFLPAAGYMVADSVFQSGSEGLYWSSSLYTELPIEACTMEFFYLNAYRSHEDRYHGFSIRPVIE